MKLNEINTQLEKLGTNKQALLTLIDLKVTQDIKVLEAEIKALSFKLNTLAWSLVVIVIGFIGKLVIGF